MHGCAGRTALAASVVAGFVREGFSRLIAVVASQSSMRTRLWAWLHIVFHQRLGVQIRAVSRFVRFLSDGDPVAAVHVPLLAGVLVSKRTLILGNSHVQQQPPPHSSISRDEAAAAGFNSATHI